MREEGQVKSEIQDVLDRRNFTTVDVDAVAHRLEGEERDAHRQNDGVYQRVRAEHLVACRREEVVDVQLDSGKVIKGVQEEVGVLVVAQDKQVDDDHDDHQELLFPMGLRLFNPLADEEVCNDAENQDADIASARLVVEEKACREQEGVAERDAALNQRKECKYDGEETPEVELRKQQRAIRIERERSC